MLLVDELIYVSTFDTGTSASDFEGRVFIFDPLAQTLTPLGAKFSGGEVPYALAWHLGRLWCGTNQGNGTTGAVYFIRPGIDAAWTSDYTMSTSTVGGVTSMRSFRGSLYVGSDNAAGAFAKILVRAVAGTYSTSDTEAGGTARVNNGVLHMTEFKDKLYATYWNPDTTNLAEIRSFDGTTWASVYDGAAGTVRPYIASFIATDPDDLQSYLYMVGGGSGLSAALVRSLSGDAGTWVDMSEYLVGPTDKTALPIVGMVGF
jgi:hypothetical protein